MKTKSLLLALFSVGSVWLFAGAARAVDDDPARIGGVLIDDDQKECPEFMKLVELGVPQNVGNVGFIKELLAPRIEQPQLSKGFDAKRAEKAVRDKLRPAKKRQKEGKAGRDLNPKSNARIDLERGRIVYLNPSRRFDARAGQEIKLSKAQAIAVAANVGDAFGVPAGELDQKGAEARVLIQAGRDVKGKEQPSRMRAEIHVRYPRVVATRGAGDIPVFDSYLITSLAAGGEVARLHLAWPDFALLPGLDAGSTIERRDVVKDVLDRVADTNLCGSVAEVRAAVAYVQVSDLDMASTGGDAGDDRETDAERRYAPALVVYVVPPEVKEDSGELGLAGEQFIVPIVRAATD